ncbi:MAG: protein phosphatase CheZ [Steroidobacteraceae bacterium]
MAVSDTSSSIKVRYGARVAALNAALEVGDDAAFGTVLDDLLHSRKPDLFGELRDLTANLHVALDRFRLDARLADFAEKEIPDARQRLAHVLKLTDEAAHRTLDLVEQSGPLAERTSQAAAALTTSWTRFRARRIELKEFHEMLKRMDAFLPAARADSDRVRNNLNEVLLTQGYQDLTGQIIRGVIELVGELETALAELARLSGADPQIVADESARSARGHGPVVPGVTRGQVASGQQDVDALLSGLGM